MILLTSIAAGVLTGWACARWQGRSWRPPLFQATWLVVLGFLPQLFAFYLPFTRRLFPDWLASASLVLSHLYLLKRPVGWLRRASWKVWRSGPDQQRQQRHLVARGANPSAPLADRFIPPSFFPYRFAFSLGDVFIGLGAFGLLARGGPAVPQPG